MCLGRESRGILFPQPNDAWKAFPDKVQKHLKMVFWCISWTSECASRKRLFSVANAVFVSYKNFFSQDFYKSGSRCYSLALQCFPEASTIFGNWRSFFLSFLLLPPFSIPSPSCNLARGLRERCKLPQRVWAKPGCQTQTNFRAHWGK